tara:strand:+ start:1148 stop:1381 length:234 start_codon:yes stop_codon:yes gene_type:complete
MNKLETLRTEINKISKHTRQHKLVSEKSNVSLSALTKIKKGDLCVLDNEPNINKLNIILTNYKEVGKEQLKNLQNIL